MKLFILKDKKQVIEQASTIISNEISRNPSLILGLATGKTMIPLYKSLVSLYKNKKINFSKITTFNLDEYLSLSSKDSRSFRYYMDKNFFNKINIKKENINFLDGLSKNISKTCKDYESKIRKVGGIDLQVLGIGENDHIAFDEPGTSINSTTRKVKLSNNTIRNNSSKGRVPSHALTIGIKNIMQARKIILIATGKNKSLAVKRALKSPPNKNFPASILQHHPRVIFIVDKSAASRLKEK